MLFNSTTYLLLFLPVVLLIFMQLARTGTTEAQITWLIVASVFFYGSWNAAYVALILASVIVNFLVGKQLVTRSATQRRRWLSDLPRLDVHEYE